MSRTCAGELYYVVVLCWRISEYDCEDPEDARDREKERTGECEGGGVMGLVEGTMNTNMANRLKAMHRHCVRQSASWHDGSAFDTFDAVEDARYLFFFLFLNFLN